LNLDIGICLGFRAWDLGFPLWGVSASCFASGFCSCLIHQAQLPNKLGNYIFKLRRATTKKVITNVVNEYMVLTEFSCWGKVSSYLLPYLMEYFDGF